MLWLFESVQAHSHGHSHDHSPALADLYISKANFFERSEQIQALYEFLAEKIGNLPDPIPLSMLPKNTLTLVGDLAKSSSDTGAVESRSPALEHLFQFGPTLNSITAAFFVSYLTNILIRFSPEFTGWKLNLLVAFAEGSILGNVFLHLMPESYESGDGWGIILGFLSFCVLDKVLKIVAKSVGHVHTHTHSAAPAVAEPAKAVTSESKSEPTLKSRTDNKEGSHSHSLEHAHAHTHDGDSKVSDSQEPQDRKIYAVLNVAADFAHNITDGVALAAAFHQSRAAGVTAFILMILHEVPHQFGDFALLLQGGASKATGLQAQMVASSGTVLGCALFGAISSEENLDWLLAVITPFTAGVFLYIGTVGVLPELLEITSDSTRENVYQSAIQLIGVLVGLFVISYFS